MLSAQVDLGKGLDPLRKSQSASRLVPRLAKSASAQTLSASQGRCAGFPREVSYSHAGTRSLLVSHWRVRDDVTAELTVAAIEAAEDESRSKALQRAMRSIRTGTTADGDAIPGWDPSWSHPAAWAPFSLVGAAQ